MTAGYLAVDWGTTNRRAYRIEADGAVADVLRDDRGVLSLAAGDYPGEIAQLRERFGVQHVIAAGMVGSNRGWRAAPYLGTPATLPALAAASVEAAPDIWIVPGVALTGARADVMRGEEVQVLGAVAAGLAPSDALFCQPGTHNKWIGVRDGAIVDFATAMTGELFALVKQGGILAGMLDGAVSDGAAFRDGLARGAGARDLAVALFEVRAAVLTGRRAAAGAAAFASGILIGADVGARDDVRDRDVHLLASGALAPLYAAAISAQGGRVIPLDSERGFAAGIHAIGRHLRSRRD